MAYLKEKNTIKCGCLENARSEGLEHPRIQLCYPVILMTPLATILEGIVNPLKKYRAKYVFWQEGSVMVISSRQGARKRDRL